MTFKPAGGEGRRIKASIGGRRVAIRKVSSGQRRENGTREERRRGAVRSGADRARRTVRRRGGDASRRVASRRMAPDRHGPRHRARPPPRRGGRRGCRGCPPPRDRAMRIVAGTATGGRGALEGTGGTAWRNEVGTRREVDERGTNIEPTAVVRGQSAFRER